tara:strand:- start:591 stop:887 length:297 start_codon:yes stop_codon:yes gene_type:complete
MSVKRYLYTPKEKNNRYTTPTYPSFARKPTDLYVFSREGDRLDLLSQEFYGDPRYWWVIAEANHIGKGSFAVQAGLQLRIPKPIDNLMTDLNEAEKNK